MNIPQTGPNPQKSKFFGEVGTAFEFLEIFYLLSKVQQNELMCLLTKLRAENEKG